MKGVAPILLVILVLVVAIPSLLVVSYYAGILAAVPVVAVTYDGEFDDAYLATKGFFYSDFEEKTDCNITSDVLGGSSYTSCIYNSTKLLASNTSSKDYVIALVLDIDGPVQDMEIDCALKNTGTGQAADDVVIADAKIYTYEDNPRQVRDLKPFIDDHTEIDGNTGILMGDEYVFWAVLHTKTISPNFVSGDDIMLCDFDLTTTEDADAARITWESSGTAL